MNVIVLFTSWHTPELTVRVEITSHARVHDDSAWRKWTGSNRRKGESK
jgi:hypothetical protein